MDKSTRRAWNIYGTLQGTLSELRACRFVERRDDSESAVDEFLALLNRSTAITEDQKLVQSVIRQMYRPGSPPRGKYNAYVLWLGSDGILSTLDIEGRIAIEFEESTEQFRRTSAQQRGQIVKEPSNGGGGRSRGDRPRRVRKAETGGIGKSGLMRAWQTLESASAKSVTFDESLGAKTSEWPTAHAAMSESPHPPLGPETKTDEPIKFTYEQLSSCLAAAGSVMPAPAGPAPAGSVMPAPAMTAPAGSVMPAPAMTVMPAPAMTTPAMPASASAMTASASAMTAADPQAAANQQSYASAAKTTSSVPIAAHSGIVMWDWGSMPPTGSG